MKLKLTTIDSEITLANKGSSVLDITLTTSRLSQPVSQSTYFYYSEKTFREFAETLYTDISWMSICNYMVDTKYE